MSFKSTLIRSAFTGKLFLQKNAPTILTVTGIALGVASTITAAVASTKVGEIQTQHQINLAKIAKDAENVQRFPETGLEYTENQQAADRQTAYMLTASAYVRLYAPSFLLGCLSIASLLSAHNILSKRYTAVAAAFTAVSKQFEEYRGHVKHQYGEDVDQEFMHNVERVEVTDKETGEVTVEKQVISEGKGDEVYFDELSPLWDSYNPDMNIVQLRSAIIQANQKFDFQGHLFLNDVYQLLGLPDTAEGSVRGWYLDNNEPNKSIDFGVFNGSEDPWDFGNDMPWDGKLGIKLVFNTDGLMWYKI